jgi:hypothetical protein
MTATNTNVPATRQRNSNWLLGRDDQVGCALFWPVDQLEYHRIGRRPA